MKTHISLNVSDVGKSIEFYTKMLLASAVRQIIRVVVKLSE